MKKQLFIFSLLFCSVISQANSYKVDNKGILRDKKTNQEVSFFGFNYCMPFAHGFRMHKELGVDHKSAIDRDIYHMSRLGINAFRIHVWDVEISDGEGNLLENTHLDLLDYTLAKCAEHNIKAIITGIAFWGNGWPEPDDKTLPGFSVNITKCDATFDPATVEAHERYLTQLMKHQNPYTGYAYATDPNIVAIEINNEPCQTRPEKAKEVTEYVNRMVKAVKKTGCKKPIFYNVAENAPMINSYLQSNIDGITFQWYPSGLVSGKARNENYLPLVSHYNIPFKDSLGYANKAKIVYEFDAADIAESYMYPAMARAFREAGFQWATQFAYDPYYMAHANTDYNTHYLNLVFTPSKAVSFAIAAAAFRNLPKGKSYGDFPKNSTFENFKVDYENGLSILNCDTIFAYSNNTHATPKNTNRLKQIIGCGSSPIVQYDGTGAYFLDKISDGVWRLEVYPDAIWTGNPFGLKNNIQRPIAVIQNNKRFITIKLPDLGERFVIKNITNKNIKTTAQQNTTIIKPGIWILSQEDINTNTLPNAINNIQTTTFFDCPTTVTRTSIVHHPMASWTMKNQVITVEVVSPEQIDSVVLVGGCKQSQLISLNLEKKNGFTWQATIPKEELKAGAFEYNFVIKTATTTITYPDGVKGEPNDWNYIGTNAYMTIVEGHTLFDSHTNMKTAELMWRKGMTFDCQAHGIMMHIEDSIAYKNNGGLEIDATQHQLDACENLEITAKTVGKQTIRVILIDKTGNYFAKSLTITHDTTAYKLGFNEFEQTALVKTREPYPWFSIKPYAPSQEREIQKDQINAVVILLENGITHDGLEIQKITAN